MYHTALQSTALRYPGSWADRGEACSSKLEQAAREDPSVDCGITSESIPISTAALEADMDEKPDSQQPVQKLMFFHIFLPIGQNLYHLRHNSKGHLQIKTSVAGTLFYKILRVQNATSQRAHHLGYLSETFSTNTGPTDSPTY